MASRPSSPPTTMTGGHELIDDWLIPQRTPVFERGYDQNFLETLHKDLERLIMRQGWRTQKYGDAADEWPVGRTPPEIKESWEAKMRAWREASISTCSTGDEDPNIIYSRAPQGKTVPAPDPLPTPAPSAESPLNTLRSTKRRRISEESGEVSVTTKDAGLKTLRSTKRRRISEESEEASVTTEDAALSTLQQSRRKRQRASGVDGGKKGGRQRRSEVRTATHTNNVWSGRLRSRPTRRAG